MAFEIIKLTYLLTMHFSMNLSRHMEHTY